MLGDDDAAMPANGDFAAHPRPRATKGILTANSSGSANTALNGASAAATSSNGVREGLERQHRPSKYHGHDAEEVTRLIIQALDDMGYTEAAADVSRTSGFQLESPTVSNLKSAILDGLWDEADELLEGAADTDGADGDGNGLVLAKGADRKMMRFRLKKQKYLELLEARDTSGALHTLRSELTPLSSNTTTTNFLSSLILTLSADELKSRAQWDGAKATSRSELLSNICKSISPSVMLPEGRLGQVLESFKRQQLDSCLFHTDPNTPTLYHNHSCPPERFPRHIALDLHDLDGEAWHVNWSPDGKSLAACGQRKVVVWDQDFNAVLTVDTRDFAREAARGNEGVGNIAWSPDSSKLAICLQDKYLRVYRLADGASILQTRRYNEPVSSCVWSLDGKSLVVGTLDPAASIVTVELEGSRESNWSRRDLRVQDMCGSPDGRWVVAMDDKRSIHVFNATTREQDYQLDLKGRPGSVCVCADSRHLLVNMTGGGEAQLIDLYTSTVVQKYKGHTLADEYIVRSTLGGAHESFVLSGSEDGYVYIWHKELGELVESIPGHAKRSNSVAWKPDDPSMFASCSDDGRVKIWADATRAAALRQGEPYSGIPRPET